jgi:hypothetical protein
VNILNNLILGLVLSARLLDIGILAAFSSAKELVLLIAALELEDLRLRSM